MTSPGVQWQDPGGVFLAPFPAGPVVLGTDVVLDPRRGIVCI